MHRGPDAGQRGAGVVVGEDIDKGSPAAAPAGGGRGGRALDAREPARRMRQARRLATRGKDLDAYATNQLLFPLGTVRIAFR
jgi:hypothetical protein